MIRNAIVFQSFLLAVLPLLAFADVYKSVDGEGRVIYSDAPPPQAVESRRLEVDECRTIECRARQERAWREVTKEYRKLEGELSSLVERDRLQILANDGKIAVGMPKSMVSQAWGRPDSVQRQSGRSGYREVWVYQKGKKKRKVTFEATGNVKSIKY